jgi:hypothetical protein
MALTSYAPIVRVKDDLPWRFKVGLVSETTGEAVPFPDGWEAQGQIRIETTGVIIGLGDPVEVAAEIGEAIFELAPAAYAALPLGQLSRFSWWMTDGEAEETQGIYPLQVIER